MLIVKNPFGQDPMDFDNETAADRVGNRIRNVRVARGLSQAELGEMIGLNADRVQKYENGARKPKSNILKKFADALEVSTLALSDPVTTSYLGAMFAMFEMEENFNMRIKQGPDNDVTEMCLTVDISDHLYDFMEEWYREYTDTQELLKGVTSEAEREEILKAYQMWKWTFPESIVKRTETNLQKQRLKKKIEELQEIYNKMDQDE